VFGVADEKWGEAVHAAIRRVPGVMEGAPELIAFVKAELGSVKAPKVIHFVPELPRNAAGKVSRADVKALVLAADRASHVPGRTPAQ
jgi:acyl-coenzyme A synthetase/AMP-(fatty) acid ligase